MLKRIFINNSPIFYIVIPVFAILLVYLSYYLKIFSTFGSDKTFIPVLNLCFDNSYFLICVIAFAASLIVSTLFISMIVYRFLMIEKGVFVPGLAFIMLMIAMQNIFGFSLPVIASVICMPVYYFLFRLYKEFKPESFLFNSSFIVAIAALVYFPAIITLVLVWITAMIFNQFSIRTLFISLIGFAIPFLFAYTHYYMNNKVDVFVAPFYTVFDKEVFEYSNNFLVFLIFTGLFILLGISRLVSHGFVKKVGTRHFYSILTYSLFLFILSVFVLNNVKLLFFVVFPASMLIGLFYVNINNKIVFNVSTLIFIFYIALSYIVF